MKRRSTKSALLMSAISLLLCVSMLIGSTFAWFTDSVTSANNIIKSGNLDVEMYWADGKEAPTSANWTDASTGAIFNYSLWEPGYVQVRHIKIANEGSLALKYNIQIKANGVVSDLSDVIDVYYMDPAAQVADRTELTEANKLGTLTEVLHNMAQTANGELIAGAEDTITLALKMQETAGNEYMNKSIGTDFSVVLLATQLTAEEDSFDDQYDKDSQYPVVNIGNTSKTEGAAASVATEDKAVQVDIPADAPEGNYALVVSDKNEKTDAEGNTTVSMDINLLKDGVKVSDGKTYTVSVKIGAALQLTKLTHNGEEITNYTYDMVSGVVTFTTTGFSPFSFTYKETDYVAAVGTEVYKTLAEAVAAAQNGATVTLLKSVQSNAAITVAGKTIAIDLNGQTVSGTFSNTGNQEMFLVKGGLTVKNGAIEMTAENNQAWNAMATIFDVTAGGKLTMDEVTASVAGTDMNFIVHLNNWGSATAEITNCDFELSYVAVRVFNSGPDMNNVTIKNTKVHGGRIFWVHNYTSADMGGKVYSGASAAYDKTAVDARLNIEMEGNTCDNAKPIRIGMTGATYYTMDGIQIVTAPITVAPAPLEKDFLFPAGTKAVLYKDMVMTDEAQIEHTENAVLGLSNVKAELDHDVIIRKSASAIYIADSEFTLTNGAKLISVGEGGDAYQVFMSNVTINGVKMDSTTIWDYVDGISYISIVSE